MILIRPAPTRRTSESQSFSGPGSQQELGLPHCPPEYPEGRRGRSSCASEAPGSGSLNPCTMRSRCHLDIEGDRGSTPRLAIVRRTMRVSSGRGSSGAGESSRIAQSFKGRLGRPGVGGTSSKSAEFFCVSIPSARRASELPPLHSGAGDPS
jgi:hypothetical protein